MNPNPINPKNLWKPFLIAAALAFVYAAVLLKLGADWWTDENYSHGLLVPFVIGGIVYLEFDELKKAVSKPAVVAGFGLIIGAFFLLLGGTLGAELVHAAHFLSRDARRNYNLFFRRENFEIARRAVRFTALGDSDSADYL